MLALFRESYGNEKEKIYVTSEDGSIIKEVKSDSAESQTICSRIVSIVKEIFLPQGYPDSVHPDYTAYQIWDTVQAFASTIMGTLTTHSIMKGIGVGESSATPLAAAITWILKNGTGMIGSIMFAWWSGTQLDGQCKKWRLFADILNDMAMGIELLVPYFLSYAGLILCVSTIMKSIVGVAGGATRAALTQHQAIRNNLADVAAKDGSQEMCVNLLASFLGIFILTLFHDGQYLIELYLFLVAVHLYANYSAVKALCLNVVNEDRLVLIIKNYMMFDQIPEPQIINKEESVFLFGSPTKSLCGFDIKMGVSLSSLLRRNVIQLMQVELSLCTYQHKKFIMLTSIESRTIFVILKKDAQPTDVLEAYFYAVINSLYACIMSSLPIDLLLTCETSEVSYQLLDLYIVVAMITRCKQISVTQVTELATMIEGIFKVHRHFTSNKYKDFFSRLEVNGWRTDINLLSAGAWRIQPELLK